MIATMTLEHRQQRLFPVEKYQAARNYEPGQWEHGPDVSWHASDSMVMPEDRGGSSSSMGGGIHVGTKQAAEERARQRSFGGYGGGVKGKTLHPVRVTGPHALPPSEDQLDYYGDTADRNAWVERYTAQPERFDSWGKKVESTHAMVWDDTAANYSNAARMKVDSFSNVIPYSNDTEHPGSVSFRAPRQNLKTWDEDVQEDPNAPNWAKAAVDRGYTLSHPMSTRGSGAPTETAQLQLDLGKQTPVATQQAAWDEHDRRVRESDQTKPRLRRP